MTICSENVVASFKENKLTDDTNQNNTLVRNPDLNDMLIEISNNYGSNENMSTHYVSSIDVGKKSYAYSHYAIDPDPREVEFEVKLDW